MRTEAVRALPDVDLFLVVGLLALLPLPAVETPLALILREPMAGEVANMVEDDRPVLPRCRSKHAADLLEVQPEAHRRAEQDRGRHDGQVEPLVYDLARGQDMEAAVAERLDAVAARVPVERAVEHVGPEPG